MPQPSNFAEFWPEYLGAHRDPRTRAMHYFGTSMAVICVLIFLGTLQWPWIVAAPFCGYGFAFLSHFVFEGNNPKTFEHPVWSFMADFYMLGRWASGTLRPEIAKLPVRA